MALHTRPVMAWRPSTRLAWRALGIATLGALLTTTGCAGVSGRGPEATRVLQAVDVRLGLSSSVESLTGTAVLVNELTGETRTVSSEYVPREVVNELPVRVTTRYKTKDRSGADLSELRGYTGRVEIEVMLENLTVAAQDLTYDAAGVSHTSPALVGVPLSVATSATLPGISPSAVVFDPEVERRTNGVVSATTSGDSLVQWGTLLAPPQSEGTTVFRIVADATNFAVPAIRIAVQAGLHTNLSFTGAVASAFDTNPDSELGRQQRAIELIAAVNDVLARAGMTVSEVRENLDETSNTLGIRTSQRLRDSAKQLVAEMSVLSSQITALGSGLAGSVGGAAGAMTTQLAEIVASMNAMLGSTKGKLPSIIQGAGCTATIEPQASDDTVYASFLYLVSLLDGYADAADGCRAEILEEIDATIGPETPNPEACAASPNISATCALAQSKATVLIALDDLVQDGQSLVAELNSATLQAGLDAHAVVSAQLGLLIAEVEKLDVQAGNPQQWEDLLAQVDSALQHTEALSLVRDSLVAASMDLVSGAGSLRAQEETVAAMLCDLITGGVPDPEAVEAIRAQIVALRCDGLTPHAAPDVPAAGPSAVRIQEIAGELEPAIDALDTDLNGSALGGLNDTLLSLKQEVSDTLDTISEGESNPQLSAEKLDQLLQDATDASDELGANLADALAEHEELKQQINAAFTAATSAAESMVDSDVETQIKSLDAQREVSKSELSESFQALIDGLRNSSDSALSDGAALVGGQKDELATTKREATEALDERTTRALKLIERSTSASTRDIRAAAGMLNDSLNKVMRDLGNPRVRGSGILGAMAASSAKSGTADAQLADASQHASGFANVRAEDIAGIMLRQAQFGAALERSAAFPPFHLEIPEGATSQTIFTFALGEARS